MGRCGHLLVDNAEVSASISKREDEAQWYTNQDLIAFWPLRRVGAFVGEHEVAARYVECFSHSICLHCSSCGCKWLAAPQFLGLPPILRELDASYRSTPRTQAWMSST